MTPSHPAPAGVVWPFLAATSAGAARQEGYFFVLERLL